MIHRLSLSFYANHYFPTLIITALHPFFQSIFYIHQFYYFLRRILFTVIANPSCPFTFNASFIMLYIVLFYLSKSIYGMQINIKILGDKVFHCVFREEFLKLTIQLCCKCFIVRYDQGWLSPINKAKTICIWIRVSFDASSNSFTCSKVYVLVSSTIIV